MMYVLVFFGAPGVRVLLADARFFADDLGVCFPTPLGVDFDRDGVGGVGFGAAFFALFVPPTLGAAASAAARCDAGTLRFLFAVDFLFSFAGRCFPIAAVGCVRARAPTCEVHD